MNVRDKRTGEFNSIVVEGDRLPESFSHLYYEVVIDEAPAINQFEELSLTEGSEVNGKWRRGYVVTPTKTKTQAIAIKKEETQKAYREELKKYNDELLCYQTEIIVYSDNNPSLELLELWKNNFILVYYRSIRDEKDRVYGLLADTNRDLGGISSSNFDVSNFKKNSEQVKAEYNSFKGGLTIG